MTRTTALVALLALAAANAPTASAQPATAAPRKTPSPKDLDEARKQFQKAEAAKAHGEYQTAAVEYLAAYELFEEPAFFYDTAEVYRLAGDEKDALTYYTKYLELAPSGQVAASARTAADQLRRSLAGKEDADRRAEDARRKAAVDAAAAKPAVATAATTDGEPAPPAPASPGRGLRIAGIATGGAGVVALGVGIGFGLKARSISNEAAHWSTFDPKRDSDGKAANRNMYVFTGVGAAAIATGSVLYYLGIRAQRARDATDVSFAPHVSRSDITLTATARF